MTKTFTQDDLIRYIYSDMDPIEKSQIEQALMCDNELLDEYHQLRAVIKEIDKVKIDPSDKVISRILDYSKSLTSHSLNEE